MMKLEYAIAQKQESIWRFRNFTLLLTASLLLSVGNKIYELLLPLIMYDLYDSSVVMTTMRTAELLPNLFFGVFVGVIVDRVNKKKWAISMILFQAVLLVIMSFMFGKNIDIPILYYLIGFMLMTLNYGYFNTQVSLIKFSVPSHFLTSANAKFSFVETFVGVMGPALLGAVLIVVEQHQGIMLTAIAYFISYILILNLSIEAPSEKRVKTSFWHDLVDGWQAFTANRALKLMTIYIIFLNCTMSVVSTTVLYFGTEELNLSNSLLSLVMSSAGIGGLLGSLLVNKLRSMYRLGLLFGISIILNMLSYIGLCLTESIPMFSVSLVLSGFATTLYIICAYTFRHEQTPQHLIGRISGITGTLFRLGMPLTMFFSGWMLAWWGATSVFISAAVFNLVIFIFYVKSILWTVK